MKAKVIMPFKDKLTGKIHDTGTTFEVTAERMAEIRKSGNYIEEVKEDKAVKADKQ